MRTVPRICFITTCMGRLVHLKETIPAAVRNRGHDIIVVDWSCPDRAGDWVRANHPGVRVVRVPDRKYFHVGRARNTGAKYTDAEWICFFDADVVLAPDFAEKMEPLLAPGGIYRCREHNVGKWGTHFVRREDFLRLGGYDVLMKGYGAEDDDLYFRYTLDGLETRSIPSELFHSIPHEVDMSVRHYENQDKLHTNTANLVYYRMKIDLMKLMGRPIGTRHRQKIKKMVDDAIARQGVDSSFLRFRLRYSWQPAPGGKGLLTSLNYLIRPGELPPGLAWRRAAEKSAIRRRRDEPGSR